MADGEKSKTPLWVAVVPALFGFLGGTVSGFTTAYVQLSTKREEYSIQRAKEFQQLMDKLSKKETARLAVLNLWQLYPEERDRRIITAAAFAVGQPDLVEIIRGIDEELEPVSDMLQARALSEDRDVSDPALQTLIKVDPVRAARVLIRRIKNDLDANGDRIRQTGGPIDPIRDLTRLANIDDTVAEMVREETRATADYLFRYILYQASRESDFITRLAGSYAEKSNLRVSSDYLLRGEYREADRRPVVVAVGAFISASLKSPEANVFDVVDAMSGLKNRDFRQSVHAEFAGDLSDELQGVIIDKQRNDTLRARALALLRLVSPAKTLTALAYAIDRGDPRDELRGEMQSLLKGGLIPHLARADPSLVRPACDDADPAACVDAPEIWADWLEKVENN